MEFLRKRERINSENHSNYQVPRTFTFYPNLHEWINYIKEFYFSGELHKQGDTVIQCPTYSSVNWKNKSTNKTYEYIMLLNDKSVLLFFKW
jgi:hypothetical protein